MSLPTQCKLLRRVQETGLVAAAAPMLDGNTAGGSSAMDEEESTDERSSDVAENTLSEAFMATGAEGGSGRSGEVSGMSAAGPGSQVAAISAVDMAKEWEELLPLGRNWHKTVYTLQIIDALLLPASVSMFFFFLSFWSYKYPLALFAWPSVFSYFYPKFVRLPSCLGKGN